MRLNLRFPPSPKFAGQHAALMVQAAQKTSRVKLKYTPQSIAIVDSIIDNMRDRGATKDQVAESLFGFGCYVGEVMVLHNGARWMQSEDAGLSDLPMVVQFGDRAVCDPIGKAFDRFAQGEKDSLMYFYYAITMADVDDETELSKPKARSLFGRLLRRSPRVDS